MAYYWPTISTTDPLVPLGKKVWIRVEEKPTKLDSGILLPESDAFFSPSDRGQVVAVGDEVKENLKAGDHVIYNWRKGDDYQYKNEHYIMLEGQDVLAVISDT